MYIPVLKNRLYENKFLRENQYLFDSNNICPMIEIIDLKIGRTACGVEDLITHYDKSIDSKYFIDFFVTTQGEYTNVDFSKVKFSLDNRDESIYNYQELLKSTIKSKLSIPVISIKRQRPFILNGTKIIELITSCQGYKDSIAVRIVAELYDEYSDLINGLLRDNDYLIYDINEETIESRFFDMHKLEEYNANYKKIILHSPRPSKLNNGSYIDGAYTGLIDNSLRDEYFSYDFDGFADYAGLKNVLPSSGGNGRGAALGLFFVDEQNVFFTIKNEDSTEGARGYNYVIDEAYNKYYSKLNPNNNCPAFDYIDNELRSRNKNGAWGQWKYITILRYISQIKQSTNNHL